MTARLIRDAHYETGTRVRWVRITAEDVYGTVSDDEHGYQLIDGDDGLKYVVESSWELVQP